MTGGITKIEDNGIVLTYGPHQQGMLWNPQNVFMSSWQATFQFSVKGSHNDGDDGFVFWFSAHPGELGPVFGHADLFKGLGVIFDSKDEDDQGNNPSIAAHLYDGKTKYNHDDDGIGNQLSGCVADYRNRDEPITARVTYKQPSSSLEVYLDLQNRGRFQRCLAVNGVILPRDYHFGFTASTTDSDDSHIIHRMTIEDFTSNVGEDVHTDVQEHVDIPNTQGHVLATALVEEHNDSPATRLKKDIKDSSEAREKRKASSDTPPSVHAAVAQHTANVARTVDQTLHRSHSDTRQHISASLNNAKEEISNKLQSQLTETANELRSLTTNLGNTISLQMTEKLNNIIHDVRLAVEEGVTGSSGASTSEAFIRMEESVRSLSSRFEKLSNDVSDKMNTAIGRLETSLTDLQFVKREMATSKQIVNLQQYIDRRMKALDEMEERLSGNIANSSGFGIFGWLLLSIPIAGIIYIIRQNKEAERYGKLI